MSRGQSCNINIGLGMQEDEEHIVQDEPLRVLDIFPKRQTSQIQLTIDKFAKLYQHLTCTICRELFKTPVYLKCSHRFCKECLQKYIRANSKKSCPNCRGQLNTKRDLHDDYLTDSFIRFAFYDPKAFTASIERADQLEISKCKSLDLRRLQSQPQIRPKLKESNEQNSMAVPNIMKRTRTDGQQPRKRGRKSNSEKRILESRPLIERDEAKEPVARKQSKSQDKKSEGAIGVGSSSKSDLVSPVVRGSLDLIKTETVRSDKKKKKIQFIQIDSNSEQEQEVLQIRKQDFFVEEDKEVCSIHHMAEEPEKEADNPAIFSFRDDRVMEVEGSCDNNPEKVIIRNESKEDPSFSMEVYEREEPMVPEQNLLGEQPMVVEQNPEVVRTLSLLRDEFGDSFQSKVIELTSFSFFGQIQIQKLPSSLICPNIGSLMLMVSLRTSIFSIISLIADLLNIKKQGVRAFILQEGKEREYRQLSGELKLYQVIQKYWRVWRGVKLVQSGELVRGGANLEGEGVERGGRVLFYSVDFSRTSP